MMRQVRYFLTGVALRRAESALPSSIQPARNLTAPGMDKFKQKNMTS